jgi:hypothetical protein
MPIPTQATPRSALAEFIFPGNVFPGNRPPKIQGLNSWIGCLAVQRPPKLHKVLPVQIRYMPVKSTPMRCMPINCMPMRYMPMRCMPMRIHAYKVHAGEMHTHEIQPMRCTSYEMRAYEVHTSMRYTLTRSTPRCMPMRCTPMRCYRKTICVRSTPHANSLALNSPSKSLPRSIPARSFTGIISIRLVVLGGPPPTLASPTPIASAKSTHLTASLPISWPPIYLGG